MGKKAFVATVGTGNNVENGIIFSIKNQNPSAVYFIVTRDSKKTADKIKDFFVEDPEIVFHKYYELEDINDVEKIYESCLTLLDEILNGGFEKSKIVTDYTSGTKAMSAALVLAAISRETESISYVYGAKRDSQTGRVITGSERLSILTPKRILDEMILTQIVSFFNNYQFTSVLDILGDPESFSPSNREVSCLIEQLSKAHNAWDKFKIKEAKELFSKVDKEAAQKNGISEGLKRVNRWLHKMDHEDEYRVWDIFFNATRRAEEGKYDDAVARLYRALEMVLQIEYERVFEKKTKKGLSDTKKCLLEQGNEIANKFVEKKDELQKVLSMRNYSILAHGENPITKEKYEKFLRLAEELVSPKEKIEFIKLKHV